MTEGTFKQLIEKELLNTLSLEERLLFHKAMDQNPNWREQFNLEKAAHLTIENAVARDLKDQFKSWDDAPKSTGARRWRGLLLSVLLIAFAAVVFLTQKTTDSKLVRKHSLKQESLALRGETNNTSDVLIEEYNKGILLFNKTKYTQAKNIFQSLELDKSSLGHKSKWMLLMIDLKTLGSEDPIFIENHQIILRAPNHTLYKQAVNLDKDLSSFWHF